MQENSRVNMMAIASFVFGVIGFLVTARVIFLLLDSLWLLLLSFLFSVLGIVCGNLAKKKMKKKQLGNGDG